VEVKKTETEETRPRPRPRPRGGWCGWRDGRRLWEWMDGRKGGLGDDRFGSGRELAAWERAQYKTVDCRPDAAGPVGSVVGAIPE
jgi:hypothetical protein